MYLANLIRNIVLGFALTLGVLAIVVLVTAIVNGDRPCTGSHIQSVVGCKSP